MKLQLPCLTKAFLETYPPKSYPKDINGGDCFNWAYLANCIYGGELYSYLHDKMGHAFIKINNKFYDSERPNGVKAWDQLPLFQDIKKYRVLIEPQLLPEAKFTQIWPVDLDDLLPILLRTKELMK